jgi:hypothetical protein
VARPTVYVNPSLDIENAMSFDIVDLLIMPYCRVAWRARVRARSCGVQEQRRHGRGCGLCHLRYGRLDGNCLGSSRPLATSYASHVCHGRTSPERSRAPASSTLRFSISLPLPPQEPECAAAAQRRADPAMVANANQSATPPQATLLALADLLGCDDSHCYGHHGRRNRCVTEVGI